MSHTPSRVLVTGAAGRLGRVVLRELAARGATAVGLDRRDPGDTETEQFFTGDAADVSLVEAAPAGVDTVIHLTAARTLLGFTTAHLFHQGSTS